jgi:hypothetical protein
MPLVSNLLHASSLQLAIVLICICVRVRFPEIVDCDAENRVSNVTDKERGVTYAQAQVPDMPHGT